VDRENNIPSYQHLRVSVDKVRNVRSFYAGKLSFANLNANGTALDLLTANAMTESFGSVPSVWSYNELKTRYTQSTRAYAGDRLNEVLDTVRAKEKFLVRKEPGYVNPLTTPGRVSAGSHHLLISTALDLQGKISSPSRTTDIEDLTLRLPSQSVFAAELAIKYFIRSASKHQLNPPLMGAIYNAGSLRPDASNAWDLKQHGDHVDRWVAFYNTSRLLSGSVAPTPTVPPSAVKPLEVKVIRKVFTPQSTQGELYVNEQFHCYTLEDVVRERGVKVYGETAIPGGRYKLAVTFSEHFQKTMPQILDVPMFQGVRIHAGNTNKDTLGCILVGKQKGEDRIWECKGVYESLLSKMNSVARKDLSFISIED
jgi:hypothetical protein